MFGLKIGRGKKRKKFRSGEIVEPGRYACTQCTHHLVLDNKSHLPQCPNCNYTKFEHVE